jgi:hypothetical protein
MAVIFNISQGRFSMSVKKTDDLILFRKVITVYFQNNMTHKCSVLFHLGSFNVTADGVNEGVVLRN